MAEGAVAASGPVAPEVGARVLEAGGNAADAAVATMLAVFVTGPVMSSPAGGGVAVVRDPRTGEAEAWDFFSRIPGRPATTLDPRGVEFAELKVRYGPNTVVGFHVGRGAAAVPGCLAGLVALHRARGRRPLSEVVAPVAELARAGAEVRPMQAHFHRLFEAILRFDPSSAALFAPAGRLLEVGDRVRVPAYAAALERMADEGRDPLTRGAQRDALLAEFGAPRGLLTRADLDAFEPAVRPALRAGFRGAEVLLPAAPSLGGELVALGLALLEPLDLPADLGHPDLLRAVAAAHEAATLARLQAASEGAPAGWLADPEAARTWRPTFERLLDRGGEGAALPGGEHPELPGNTTHVSAVDEDGLVVSMTTSSGESCGVLAPGLGLSMNNFLGEEDINPAGFHAGVPGGVLETRMTPTIVRTAEGGLHALGTGGSSRITSVVLQAVLRLALGEADPAALVARGRVHRAPEGTFVEAEGLEPAALGALVQAYPGVEVFPRRDLFFGGLHVVARGPSGGLAAAGDPRRDGGAALTRSR